MTCNGGISQRSKASSLGIEPESKKWHAGSLCYTAETEFDMNPDNICSNCSINQACCSDLTRLRLSKAEFERNFHGHSEFLHVSEFRGMYEVSGNGTCCPNWENNRCRVYGSRPIECRIFPFTIGSVLLSGKTAILTYHHRTRCPQKDLLRISPTEVRRMLRLFIKEAFGRETRALILPDVYLLRILGWFIHLPKKLSG